VSDLLTLAGHLELLGGGVVSTNPACAGAMFRLDDPWDLGSPQLVSELLATLTLDGEKPSGSRVSNRTIVLPVLIQAPTSLLVESAREVLLQTVAAEQWTMTLTRDPEGGTPLPLVFDCYAATASVPVYSIKEERAHLAHLTLTFPAAPYGRSDLPVEVDFPAAVAGRPVPPPPVTVDDFGSVTNFLTGQNTGFEGGIGTWVPGTNCTVAGTSAQAHTGSSALAMTSVAAGNMNAQHCSDATAQGQGGPCAAGDVITVTQWFRAATAARPCQVAAAFYDVSNTRLSTVFGPTTNDSTSAWTQVSSPLTVPAGAVRWVAVAEVLSAGAAGEVHYVDDVAGPTVLTPAQWSQALVGPGLFSAHWDPAAGPANNPSGVGMAPVLTKTGLSLDLCQGWTGISQSGGSGVNQATLFAQDAAPIKLGDKFQLALNTLTGDNAGFEGGSTGNWGGWTNSTNANSVAQAHSGTHSMLMASVAAGNMSSTLDTPSTGAAATACLPGDLVYVSGWSRAQTTPRQTQIGVIFFDASFNQVGGIVFGAVIFGAASLANTTTGWTQVQQQTYAPAGAAWALPIPQVVATGGAAEGHFWDDFVIAGHGSVPVQAQQFTVTSISLPSIGYVNVGFTPNAAVALSVGEVLIQTSPSRVPALKVYAGFGSSRYFRNWARAGGSVQFQFTLTDGANSVSFSVTRKGIKGSNNSGSPVWYLIQAAVPQTSAVNLRAVTGYTVKVVNAGTTALPYTDLYLDSLTAAPVAVAALALQRGQVHTLGGIIGTARGPATWHFQQQGTAALVTKKWAIPGTYLWQAPPLVTSYAGFAQGGCGDGAPFLPVGGGGGSGASSAQDGAVAVTPGQWYKIVVGARGFSGNISQNGSPSSFAGDTVTRTAPGGITATTTTGAPAPAAGFGGFAGGPGGNGTNNGTGGGGAGGGSAGTSANGNPGGAAAAGTGGVPGAAVAGGAQGGRGGTFSIGNGGAPAAGYGAGNGGSPAFGSGRRDYGGFGDGYVQISYLQPPQAKTLIVHRPRRQAPDTLCPFISIPVTDVPDGTTEYPVQSMIPGLNARFDGTYTVYAINAAWNNPSASRNLFVTIKQYEQPGGTMNAVSTPVKSFVPNTDPDVSKNGIVNLGEITLPDKKIPAENLAALFTATITDSNTSDDWYDLLLIDTQGSTLVINSTVPYTNYFVDEPGESDLGLIMGSATDRDSAVSVTSQALAISGPPLGVNPEGCQTLLVYAVDGNGAPGVYMTYYPRWRVSRTA
jgi:hypothetical protein